MVGGIGLDFSGMGIHAEADASRSAAVPMVERSKASEVEGAAQGPASAALCHNSSQ